ncbi:MAG: hypothetical protein CFE26_11515 [Verrucomicrobiales bacterium VVV1]|nr:MAG: hypothetical protein CFE26_11515 [Verrucomicrobiales bacterium VVV1]
MTPSKFSLPRYEHFTAKPGFFLAQVAGESVNRRIPNGWPIPEIQDFLRRHRREPIRKVTIQRVEMLKCDT